MKGDTLNFIGACFGCTKMEGEFVDNLCDNLFPSFGDWTEYIFDDWQKEYGGLCDFLISKLYDEVIDYYVDLGLDEDKFDTEINSVCSGLLYDDEYVTEAELDVLVEQLDNND